jgi:hypothetical protein
VTKSQVRGDAMRKGEISKLNHVANNVRGTGFKMEGGQYTKYKEDIGQQSDVCYKTSIVVIQYHEDDDNQDVSNEGKQTCIN